MARLIQAVRKRFTRPQFRVVALLAARNEELYIGRCLEYLFSQGIETCVIDNDSTDATPDIVRSFLGRGVFRIEKKRYDGYHDYAGVLRLQEKLSRDIDAAWFIRHDADEVFQAPDCRQTLREAIMDVDRARCNAINFDEFVFLPSSEDESFEGTDYVERMRYYYFFSPGPLRLVRAWKKTFWPVDLSTAGGHRAAFRRRRVYPENFILRHYMGLSREHIIDKYARQRVYSPAEVQRGWHRQRAAFDPGRVQLMRRDELIRCSGDGLWDRSRPFTRHRLFSPE